MGALGDALGIQHDHQAGLIPVVAGDPNVLDTEDVPWILRRQKMINLTEHENEEEGIREVARTILQVA